MRHPPPLRRHRRAVYLRLARTRGRRLGYWLLRHALPIFFVACVLLALSIFATVWKSRQTRDVVQAAAVTKNRQVAGLRRDKQQLRQTVVITAKARDSALVVRDSAVAVAVQKTALLDSVLHVPADENLPADPASPDIRRVRRYLSNYVPRPYPTGRGDSLR